MTLQRATFMVFFVHCVPLSASLYDASEFIWWRSVYFSFQLEKNMHFAMINPVKAPPAAGI